MLHNSACSFVTHIILIKYGSLESSKRRRNEARSEMSDPGYKGQQDAIRLKVMLLAPCTEVAGP